MSTSELIRSRQQLVSVADMLAEDLRGRDFAVSRYIRLVIDAATFINGQSSRVMYATSNVNRELMREGVYTQSGVDDLLPHNVPEVIVARDLQEHRFNFSHKGFPLPEGRNAYEELAPSNVDVFDDEFRAFTKNHRNTRITRSLTVEQRVVVNSKGGLAVESIPFFGISYSHGYRPIPTNRDITVVCAKNDDVLRLPMLIPFIADPTPDGRIRSAKTFTDAFHALFEVSGLKYGSLQEAGIPLSELYDIVMLTGVPAHEIFGHHFEEPIRYLDFGESGTFKHDQSIQNQDIVLRDDPSHRVAGFRVLGFANFDAYGRPRGSITHIEGGKIHEFLGSEYADPEKIPKFLNVPKSTACGNAVQYDDGFFPQPRMSCTVLSGKTEAVDLEGKILLVPHEGHTTPQDKTYMVKALEAYVVRDGIPRRIIPLQVTGGINQALGNITLLPVASYQTGTCGKPEPIYYPQSHGTARAPVSQFANNQLWSGQQVYPLPISDTHLRILTSQKE